MLPSVKAKYLAKAISCSFGVSSNGNYQIGISMEVTEGDHAGSEITWIGHFTEKTQDRTFESLRHFGWEGYDLSELEDLDAMGCAQKLPNFVEIACDTEEYNGETQLKVKWVNRPGGSRFAFKDKLEGNELKKFAAQMKGALRSSRPANGAAKKPTPPHPNAPGNDDAPF